MAAPSPHLGTGIITPPRNDLAPCPGAQHGGTRHPKERGERRTPQRGSPGETGEPRRREPRCGAAAARQGEARTHIRGRWRQPASMGVPGTARAGLGRATAGGKQAKRVNCSSPLPPPGPKPPALATAQGRARPFGRCQTQTGHRTTAGAWAAEGGRRMGHNPLCRKVSVFWGASFSHCGFEQLPSGSPAGAWLSGAGPGTGPCPGCPTGPPQQGGKPARVGTRSTSSGERPLALFPAPGLGGH